MGISDKRYNVYIDGVFDLFHRGHLEAINKARTVRDNVYLMVGVISDNDAISYKRKPIFHEDDRYSIINSIKGIDQVIFPAPLIVTPDFVKKHNIDIVLHGFSDINDYNKQQEFYKNVSNVFEMIPYFPYTSTSSYIEKIYSLFNDSNNNDDNNNDSNNNDNTNNDSNNNDSNNKNDLIEI